MSSKIDSNQTFISTPAKIKYWHILAILSLALFSYCSNQPEYPSVDAILCQPKPEPPILTSVSAICFAMHFEGIADSMRKAQKQASYTGWNASAQLQNNEDWVVLFRSSGRLPAFSCRVSFNKGGNSFKIISLGFQK